MTTHRRSRTRPRARPGRAVQCVKLGGAPSDLAGHLESIRETRDWPVSAALPRSCTRDSHRPPEPSTSMTVHPDVSPRFGERTGHVTAAVPRRRQRTHTPSADDRRHATDSSSAPDREARVVDEAVSAIDHVGRPLRPIMRVTGSAPGRALAAGRRSVTWNPPSAADRPCCISRRRQRGRGSRHPHCPAGATPRRRSTRRRGSGRGASGCR